MPSVVVLGDAVGDLLVAADQRGARAAAHEADARPQVGGDLELVGAAAVQRDHAPLALGLRGARARPGPRAISAGSRPASSRSASAHASSDVSRVMTCRRIPKRSSRPARAGGLAHAVELLRDLRRRLAPGEVDVGVAGGDLERGGRRAAEVDRRGAPAGRRRCAPSTWTCSPAKSTLARPSAAQHVPGTRRPGRSARPCRGSRRSGAARRRRRRRRRSAAAARRRSAGRSRPSAPRASGDRNAGPEGDQELQPLGLLGERRGQRPTRPRTSSRSASAPPRSPPARPRARPAPR